MDGFNIRELEQKSEVEQEIRVIDEEQEGRNIVPISKHTSLQEKLNIQNNLTNSQESQVEYQNQSQEDQRSVEPKGSMITSGIGIDDKYSTQAKIEIIQEDGIGSANNDSPIVNPKLRDELKL